ncbi:MAG: hypothetical protein RMJ98_18755 [Myxococcales bacterium]|nr:hypothetical protein [Polyangiaceae bacterium]MDW8251341.1 hypothetical protein [Myxococcales bacterium]
MLRAIAIATDTSDVVGTLDLVCEEGGLRLHFVRASTYATDYIPALALRGQKLLVPYEAIREVQDDGETLRLVLAAARFPHRRLILTHFTRDLRQDATRIHRRRRQVQAAVAAASALLAGGLALGARLLGALPSTLVTLFGTALAVGGGVWLSQAVGRRVMLGGAETAAERQAFFCEINRHIARARGSVLPLEPALSASSAAPPLLDTPGSLPGPDVGPLAELYPTFVAVGVATLVALGALSAGRSTLAPSASAPASAVPTGFSQPPPPTSAAALVEEPLGLCMCQGPSSPYLPGRLPRLTVLPRVEHKRDDPQRPNLSLEVAVVNNSSTPLREVKGHITFFTPPPTLGGAPRPRTERGFYYEGPLLPGHAIKWHLSGRGSLYRIQHDFEEPLADHELAPADAFAKLLYARTRSVRLHGATMLTRLRDERALRAIEGLREGASEEEQELLSALARAAAPTYVCEIEQENEGSSLRIAACVMNTTEEEVGPVDVLVGIPTRDATTEFPPMSRWTLRQRILLPPRTGIRVRGILKNTPPLPGVEVLLEPSK